MRTGIKEGRPYHRAGASTAKTRQLKKLVEKQAWFKKQRDIVPKVEEMDRHKQEKRGSMSNGG